MGLRWGSVVVVMILTWNVMLAGGIRTTVWRRYRPTKKSHINLHRVVDFALRKGFAETSGLDDTKQLVEGLVEYLQNRDMLEYYGTIRVGSSQQPMNVVFDTGSDVCSLLVVVVDPMATCCWLPKLPHIHPLRPSCLPHLQEYVDDPDHRGTFKVVIEPQYQLGSVKGHECMDDIIVSKTHVTGMKFLCAFQDSDLAVELGNKDAQGTAASGVLVQGIEPTQQQGLNIGSYSSAKNYGLMHYLKQQASVKCEAQNAVSQAMMGVYMSKVENDSNSHIDFGELDHGLMGNKSIYWIGAISATNWIIDLNALEVGNKSVALRASAAIVDTGSSYISIPTIDFINIAPFFQQRFACSFLDTSTYYCLTQSRSYDEFPILRLELGPSKFTLKPKDYVQFVGPSGDPQMDIQVKGFQYALLKFVVLGTLDYWILGDNFLQNYYTIYDFEERKIGFVEYSIRILCRLEDSIEPASMSTSDAIINNLIYVAIACAVILIFIYSIVYQVFVVH